MDETLDFLISRGAMRLDADLVIQPRVGRHLCDAESARPIFGGLHQRLANALTAQIFIHVPAFDVTDGTAEGAIGIFARSGFDEGAEFSIGSFHDEDRS